jgi:hypothetical protein
VSVTTSLGYDNILFLFAAITKNRDWLLVILGKQISQ